MDKHGMCLQLHVSIDPGGPEVPLNDRPGLSRGAKSGTFKTSEDISLYASVHTHTSLRWLLKKMTIIFIENKLRELIYIHFNAFLMKEMLYLLRNTSTIKK